MAEKRTIDINIKNNADEAAKDFNHFNDALDETAKSAKNVNSTFEEVYGDLQPLTTRLGEAEDRLYELALAGQTTSKEYQELLEKVGQYRKVQIQTDLAVDGAAQTLNQKLGSALNGVTSAFAATQGAMALFGSENEALEKTLLKVQAALAIQQGVKGLNDAYKELGKSTGIATSLQKGFNKILKANPIILIVSAIAAGVAALATFTDVLDPLIDKLKQLSDFIGLTDFAEEEAHEKTKQRIREEKAEREAAFNARQKQFDREIAMLEAEGKSSFKLRQQKLQDIIAVQKAELKAFQVTEEQRQALAQVGGFELVNEVRKKEEEIINAIADAENQLKINVINNNKEKADSYRNYADERKNIARQIEDLENELLEDGLEKELEINRDKFRRLREDAEGNAKEQAILRALYLEQEAKAEAEIRNKFRKESLQEEIDFFTENKLPVLEAQADKEVEVEINKWSLIGQAQAEAYKKEEALRKRNQEFAVQTTLDGLNLISDITELFGKKGEKQAKKAFQVQKAAQIATATIETYLSAQKAYTSQLIPGDPTSPVRAGIAAGVAVAAGLANVAKIASQKFEGGGATGGGSDFSDGGVGGGEVAPQFNVVGDAGINQLAQLQQQPTQAYVVSGEVTSAQALDRNRVTNATL